MKTSKRIKISLPNLTTRDDAECAMRELAIAVNSQRKVLADRDAAIIKINERVEAPLAELDQLIKAHTDALRAWAESNPDQFPRDRKSIAMTSGTLGFRTGQPKLALLSRVWNWEKVLQTMKRAAWCIPYIRVKEEVDKETLLSAVKGCTIFHDHKPEVTLATVGLKITQDESFFIEPDLTSFEPRQTTEAA